MIKTDEFATVWSRIPGFGGKCIPKCTPKGRIGKVVIWRGNRGIRFSLIAKNADLGRLSPKKCGKWCPIVGQIVGKEKEKKELDRT